MRFEDLIRSCKATCHEQDTYGDVDGDTVIRIHKIFSSISSKDANDLAFILKNHHVLSILRQRTTYPTNLSPIHQCVRIDKPDCLESLLRAGANVNAREIGSTLTALHMAVINRQSSAVDLLLSYGADASLTATNHCETGKTISGTALEMAYKMPLSQRDNAIVEMLERRGDSGSAIVFLLQENLNCSIKKNILELREERDKAIAIWMEIDKATDELKMIAERDPFVGAMQNGTFELLWKLEGLEMNSDFRTKSRLVCISHEIDGLEKLKLEHEAKAATKTAMICPVCLELPSGKIYNCQTCDNLICIICMKNVLLGGKKCPSCRQDLASLPFLRNRLVERILAAMKK